MEPDLRPLATASDVAHACAVSPPHVLRMAERGDIPSLRISQKCVRFVPAQVEAALGLPHGLIQSIKNMKMGPPPQTTNRRRQFWR